MSLGMQGAPDMETESRALSTPRSQYGAAAAPKHRTDPTGKQSPCTCKSGKGLRSPRPGVGPPSTRRSRRQAHRGAEATSMEEVGRGSRGWWLGSRPGGGGGKQCHPPPRSWKGPGRTLPGGLEGTQPAATLISGLGLQLWGRMNFHCSALPSSPWRGLSTSPGA